MISAADVGRRVSVQYVLDDGSRSEAVGVLEQAEAEGGAILFRIRRRDGSVLTIPADRIRYGKVIPPR